MNDEFHLIEGCQTYSILMIGRYIRASLCSTMLEWNLVVASAN